MPKNSLTKQSLDTYVHVKNTLGLNNPC